MLFYPNPLFETRDHACHFRDLSIMNRMNGDSLIVEKVQQCSQHALFNMTSPGILTYCTVPGDWPFRIADW